MKKLSLRAYFALALAAILALGAVVFSITYFVKADEWVTFSGSPHVYSGANLSVGYVEDRDGTQLLDATDGRTYAEDAQTRASTMHLLGDRYGYIYAPLLGAYADKMIGYDKINGLYTLREEHSTATLSISAAAQNAALQALAGRRGTVGVYNYETGEILCAVTSPSYDPDNMPDVEGDTTGAYTGVYLNRFFDVTYTPGSIFKLVTSAAAIEEISDIDTQSFACNGTSIIGGQKIVCEGVHGTIDFKNGLAHSCNVVFGDIAVELGGKTLQKYAEKVGLTKRLDCDGYQTAAGSVDLTKAEDGDVAWAGIGQYTDQVSAYAFMRYMGIIAGGGEAAEPYLMSSVRKGEKMTYAAKRVSTGRVLEEETAQTLAEMMRYNVENIYGAWQFGDLKVCAKSGTAEQEGQTANAMFAGFVQDESCPLAFVVFVENGGSGSAVAAPIAAAVLQTCAAKLQKN